jgi:hypothetical protein
MSGKEMPMNKGFAVLAKLVGPDRLSVHWCIFINRFAILVCLRSLKFAHIATGSDPTVTQESIAKKIRCHRRNVTTSRPVFQAMCLSTMPIARTCRTGGSRHF